MTPQMDVRARRLCAGLGAACLAYLASAEAPSFSARADAPPAGTAAPIALRVASRSLAYGRPEVVSGTAPGAQRGEEVDLQFALAGGPWTTVARSSTAAGGRFRLTAHLTRNGSVRVALAPRARASQAGAPEIPATGGALSPAAPVAVAARLTTARAGTDVLAGHPVVVRGQVGPAVRGRRVALQVRRGRHWQTVAKATVRGRGAFALRFVPRSAGTQPARVRFGGDSVNGAATRTLAIDAYAPVGASWYGGGPGVACAGLGGVRMGVANKTLPCGTRVRLRLGGRSVTAIVNDRGPYVAGRDYDLSPAVKAALGFGDTGTIWATRT